jgi:uncharacterized protein (TIGR02453 family)
MAASCFGPELFKFLKQLRANNDRSWFAANKEKYERDVRDPMLGFIRDMAAPLAQISREIVADPRPAGGSLFRIYRDTRFAKDKSPYKTHVAAQFRHRGGKDVHAPGFYLHLEPGGVFAGAGLWRPEPPVLHAVRKAIAKNALAWNKVLSDRAFRRVCALTGESAKRPPRGFDPAHPLIEDIKRKDYVAVARFTEADALSSGFRKRFSSFCQAAAPLNAFLARALRLGW